MNPRKYQPLISVPKKSLEKLCMGLLFIFLALLFFRPIETDDIWWHLATGRYIFEHACVPRVNIFPFGSETTPWVFTQWLGSLVYYLIFLAGGENGLPLFRAFFFVFILLTFFHYARKRIPIALLIPLVFVCAFGLSTRCLLRPLVFNLLFVPLFILILLNTLDTLNRKRLWLLLILGAVWSNFHLGSFYYGFLIIGVFWLAEVIKWLEGQFPRRGRGNWPSPALKDLSLLLLAYPFSFLFSPYGIDAALYPWKIFLFPQHINFYHYSYVISEMHPPLFLLELKGIWVFILIGVAAAALFFNPKHKLHLTTLVVIAAFCFFYSQRNADFFVIVAAYAIACCAGNIGIKNFWDSLSFSRRWNQWILLFILIILSANILHVWNNNIFYRGRGQKVLALFEEPTTPKESIELLKKNNITGRVFNNDLYGGYLFWRAYPNLKPFVDGRQLNQDFYLSYLQTFHDPQKNWPRLDRLFHFDIALITTGLAVTGKLTRYLLSDPEWQLIDIKVPCLLFVKKGGFALPDDLAHYEERLKSTSLSTDEIKAVLHNINPPRKNLTTRLKDFVFPPPNYIDLLDQAITLYDLGFKKAGLDCLLKTFRLFPDEDIKKILTLVWEDYKKGE